MDKRFRLGVALLALAAAGCGESKRDAAVVNGEKITEDEFRALMLESPTAKNVMRDLILTRLIDQEARKQQITVTDQEIDGLLQFQRDRMPPGRFDEEIAKSSSPASVRRATRRDIELRAMSMKGAKVTDAEIDKFYKDHASAFVKPEWREVAFLVTKNATDAKKAIGLLKQGVDFLKVQQQFAANPAVKASKVAPYQWLAIQGNNITSEQQQPVNLPPDVAKAIRTAAQGQVAGPVELKGMGSLVIHVRTVAKGGKIPLESVKSLIAYQIASTKNQVKPSEQIVRDILKTAKIDVKLERLKELSDPEKLMPEQQPGMGAPSAG
jgi:hypothetical protein